MKKKKKKPASLKLLIVNIAIIGISLLLIHSLQQPKQVTVEATVLNVRQNPSRNAKIIKQLPAGEKVTVLQAKNKWYEIQLSNGQTGWIASWLVQDKTKGKPMNAIAYIAKDNATLYEDYFTGSNVITTLEKGKEVKILQKHNNWRLIQSGQLKGWTQASSLTVGTTQKADQTTQLAQGAEESATSGKRYVRQKNVSLREKPNADSKAVTQLDMGDKLTVIGKEGEWYHVKTAFGDEGYIASWLTTTKNLAQDDKKVSKLSKAVIVIDPGHGGQDAGSISADNRYEKDATMETSETVAKALRAKGAKVILTRSSDEYVGLEERAQVSNRNKADAFICIHFDSTAQENVASGTTTYYYHDNSKLLADKLNQQIAKLPLPNRGVEFGDHQVTRDNNQPAVLLELGYMSNTKDVHLIFSKSYQRQIADAIVTGLENYFAAQ